MATQNAIRTETDRNIRRIKEALGLAFVLPKHQKFVPFPHEYRRMAELGAIADALEAKDPSDAPPMSADFESENVNAEEQNAEASL